jgi:hypothetical protein
VDFFQTPRPGRPNFSARPGPKPGPTASLN